MVSSPNRDDLVFPKVPTFAHYKSKWKHFVSVILVNLFAYLLFYYQGGWEDDETAEEAACREALEEAGVRGMLKVGFPFLTLSQRLLVSDS